MAKQIITKLLDDIDGGDADETLTFALDGNGYQIDLSSRHSRELRDFLSRYIEAGTRTGRVGQGAQLQKAKPYPIADSNGHMVSVQQNKERNSAIRSWAVAQGLDVNERGRIPIHIVDAFDAQHSAQTVVDEVKKASNVPEVSFTAETRPRRTSRARAS